MRNVFQNKKVLISIIVAVVVIVVAIVLFVVLGKNGDNKKSDGNSTIKFSDEKKENNKTLAGNNTNTSSDKTENKTNNNTTDKVSVGSDVEDFHKKAAEQFVEAFMDEDAMNEFLENYIDMKAYIAYEKVNGEDSRFIDEYNSLPDDDSAIEEAKEACLAVPSSYNMMLTFIDSAMQMAKQYSEMSNQTGESTDNTIDYDSFTDEDKKLVLKAIKNPEKSEDDENITKIRITCAWMQEDVDLDMVFYGDVVIFICDEEGTSITESGLNQGSGMSGLDEEN